MTGKKRGVCIENRGCRGFDQGQDRGVGFGRGYGSQREESNNETFKQDDLSILKTQVDVLECTLNNIKEKISKLR